MFIFQIYLPCSNLSISIYRTYIEKLYNLYSIYSSTGSVVFLGDFNAKYDLNSSISRDQFLCRFLSDVNLVAINSLPNCQGASYSYVSYDGSICTPIEILDLIQYCEIVDDQCLNVSRHRPVICRLAIPGLDIHPTITINPESSINWKRVQNEHVDNYINRLTTDPSLVALVSSSLQMAPEIDKAYSTLTTTCNMPISHYRRKGTNLT